MTLKLRKTGHYKIWPLIVVTTMAIPWTIYGEVMDKEMSITDIKHALFISLFPA